MKHLLIILSLYLTPSAFTQTNIISLKSHAGDLTQIAYETDNFGGPEIIIRPINFSVDTVVFVKNGCLIQIYEAGFKDTVYSEEIGKVLTPRITNNYPENTVFIGFKTPKKQEEYKNHFFNDMKRNGFPILLMILLGIFGVQNLIKQKN